MPKLFPIHIEVEEVFVGAVMRRLHGMEGVAKVNLDLGETPRKPNGVTNPAKKFEQGASEYITELLSKSPMPTKVLRDHFSDVGRKPGSTSSALNQLKRDGEIKKLPDGKTWTLTKKMKDRLRYRNK